MNLARVVILLLASASAIALAQPFPNKPIRITVGFPPGGGTDLTTRYLAPHLSRELGQPIVVDNKPGAGGTIAAAELARMPADGYSLILANIGPWALAPNMLAKRPYDPVNDFTAIGQVLSTYFILAVPADHPASSISSFIAWAKANVGRANFASGGSGSITHLNGELLNQVTGTKLAHVPYKGTGAALADLLAGRTHAMIEVGAVLLPHIQSGKLKALLVTSPTRFAELPDVPTAREANLQGLETSGWQGFVGPAGLPKDITATLYDALRKSLARPEVQAHFANLGTPVTQRDPKEFAAFIRDENERWIPVIKASGARID